MKKKNYIKRKHRSFCYVLLSNKLCTLYTFDGALKHSIGVIIIELYANKGTEIRFRYWRFYSFEIAEGWIWTQLCTAAEHIMPRRCRRRNHCIIIYTLRIGICIFYVGWITSWRRELYTLWITQRIYVDDNDSLLRFFLANFHKKIEKKIISTFINCAYTYCTRA